MFHILKLIPSSIFGLETWGFFYFAENVVYYKIMNR